MDHSGTLVGRMNLLVLQVGVIILSAWLGGALFNKLRLPRVLGEVSSGILIGPYLLGNMALPFFPVGLFPLYDAFPVSPELYGLAVIASIVLLFLVGLETDVELLFKFSATGAIVGISGIIMSFASGAAAGAIFMRYFYGGSFTLTHPVPLFLGVISTATSVGITARVLSKRKRMDSPEGVTTISAAVIDDVLGIIAFAVVIGIARVGHMAWQNVVTISLKAIGLWLIFTLAGLAFSNIIARFLKKFKDRPTMAVMSFALALILAGVFEKSGLAMIIGAYVMGISVSKTDISFVVQENLSVLNKFFVPIFFCVMGMLIDLRQIARPEILYFGLLYTFLAVAGKIFGCGMPPLFMNFNLRGAARIAVGMVPRGEVALIISGIGLSLGLINRDVFSLAIIMTFLTTLLTPPVLNLLLRSDKTTLKKTSPVKKNIETINYSLPNPETADLILGKTLADFENEGFFVHRVSVPDTLYQIRKDDVSITLKRLPQELMFECSEDDAFFVHTVFYEVIAELEELMKRLESVSDKKRISQDIFDHAHSKGKERVKISDVIRPRAVTTELSGNSKKEVITELVDLLIYSGDLHVEKREDVLKELAERESTMSTGMQEGIALPHTKTPAVDRLISAIGLKKAGVDFDSLDKKPATILVLTLAPKYHQEPYLQYVGEITKVLINPDNRRRILSSKTNEELFAAIANPGTDSN